MIKAIFFILIVQTNSGEIRANMHNASMHQCNAYVKVISSLSMQSLNGLLDSLSEESIKPSDIKERLVYVGCDKQWLSS